MKKTIHNAIEDLGFIYEKIIELLPYQNDPEIDRQLRELRIKANKIEKIEIEY